VPDRAPRSNSAGPAVAWGLSRIPTATLLRLRIVRALGRRLAPARIATR
jgi:hypothetical protein